MPPFALSLMGLLVVMLLYGMIDRLPEIYRVYAQSSVYLLFAGGVYYVGKGDRVWEIIAGVFALYGIVRLFL